MKYKLLVKAKNSGNINTRMIEGIGNEEIKTKRQLNSLLTVTFLNTFGDIKHIITNVVEIERIE
jgi:hypothetical protein